MLVSSISAYSDGSSPILAGGQSNSEVALPAEAAGAKNGCDCGACSQCLGNAPKSRLLDAASGEAAVFEKSADRASAEVNPGEEAVDGSGLTAEEQETVKQLKARDREVRQHEQAHLAAAGPHAKGGPTYDYTTGPDGQRYAIGGEVQIDTSPIPNDPEATIQKAQTIKRAALAPAEPSDQDLRVAAQADQIMREAQQDLAEQTREAAKQGYNPQGQVVSGSVEPAIFELII